MHSVQSGFLQGNKWDRCLCQVPNRKVFRRTGSLSDVVRICEFKLAYRVLGDRLPGLPPWNLYDCGRHGARGGEGRRTDLYAQPHHDEHHSSAGNHDEHHSSAGNHYNTHAHSNDYNTHADPRALSTDRN